MNQYGGAPQVPASDPSRSVAAIVIVTIVSLFVMGLQAFLKGWFSLVLVPGLLLTVPLVIAWAVSGVRRLHRLRLGAGGVAPGIAALALAHVLVPGVSDSDYLLLGVVRVASSPAVTLCAVGAATALICSIVLLIRHVTWRPHPTGRDHLARC